MLGMLANRNPQRSWFAVAKSEDYLMRKILFGAIAALAMVFGDLAVASASPPPGYHYGEALAQVHYIP